LLFSYSFGLLLDFNQTLAYLNYLRCLDQIPLA